MDDEDDVWRTDQVTPPDMDIVHEAHFCSTSDPSVSVAYTEGDTSHDRTGQSIELHFSEARGIKLDELEDGLMITCEEHGDAVGPMLGHALLWAGWQLLHQADKAAEVEKQDTFEDLLGRSPGWVMKGK